MNSRHLVSIAVIFLMCGAKVAVAGDREFGALQGFGSDVPGWRLGPERERGGYAIYRRAGHGWHRVGGAAIKIAGTPGNPWIINDANRIYYWTGRDWARTPGRAVDVADGWVLGLDRESGGYGIYRWNGRDWDQVPGGAVEIGGSYEHPWVINNRGLRYVWNGRDWVSQRSYHNSFSRGFQGHDRERHDRRDDHAETARRRSDW